MWIFPRPTRPDLAIRTKSPCCACSCRASGLRCRKNAVYQILCQMCRGLSREVECRNATLPAALKQTWATCRPCAPPAAENSLFPDSSFHPSENMVYLSHRGDCNHRRFAKSLPEGMRRKGLAVVRLEMKEAGIMEQRFFICEHCGKRRTGGMLRRKDEGNHPRHDGRRR